MSFSAVVAKCVPRVHRTLKRADRPVTVSELARRADVSRAVTEAAIACLVEEGRARATRGGFEVTR